MTTTQLQNMNEDDLPIAFNPMGIWLETASACNLRCKMCAVHADDGPMQQKPSKLMKKELFFSIVDQTANWNITYYLHYYGEPLMHPDFIQFLRYCKQNAPQNRVSFFTNGVLMTPSFTDRMLDAGFNEIFISLDGDSKEVYEKIRIRSDYNIVLKNVEYLIAERNRLNLSVNVGLSYTVQDLNRHEQKAFYDRWKNCVDVIHFGKEIEVNTKNNDTYFPVDKKMECSLIKKQLIIDPDGTVTVCCPDALNTLSIGNAAITPLKKILSSRRTHDTVAKIMSKDIDTIPVCKNCSMRGVQEERTEVSNNEVVVMTPWMKKIYFSNPPITTDMATLMRLDGPFQHEIGQAWLFKLPQFVDQADTATKQSFSKLMLFEDGVMLQHNHTLHSVIRDSGKGTYSHWNEHLLFSSTDNTDPNTNGRKYEIAFAK